MWTPPFLHQRQHGNSQCELRHSSTNDIMETHHVNTAIPPPMTSWKLTMWTPPFLHQWYHENSQCELHQWHHGNSQCEFRHSTSNDIVEAHNVKSVIPPPMTSWKLTIWTPPFLHQWHHGNSQCEHRHSSTNDIMETLNVNSTNDILETLNMNSAIPPSMTSLHSQCKLRHFAINDIMKTPIVNSAIPPPMISWKLSMWTPPFLHQWHHQQLTWKTAKEWAKPITDSSTRTHEHHLLCTLKLASCQCAQHTNTKTWRLIHLYGECHIHVNTSVLSMSWQT